VPSGGKTKFKGRGNEIFLQRAEHNMEQKQFPRFNKQEADVVVAKMKEMLGPELTAMVEKSGLNSNQMIRFQYIGTVCKVRRAERSLELKSVSKQLRVPQYRLKAVEGSDIGGILPDVLQRYAEYLSIDGEFEDWKQENTDIWDVIRGNAK
jgi:hypothetical protein